MLALPQKTLELLLVGAGQIGRRVEPPLLLRALLLQKVIVAGATALQPAVLACHKAPCGTLVGLHLRHISSTFLVSATREEARGTGERAGSPPGIAGLVYQTVAYLRAARSLRSPCGASSPCWASLDSFFGAMTMTMLRPSRLGWLSMRPRSSRSVARRLRSLSPKSGCWTSRPRNMMVTFTLSPPRRKRSTWPRLVLKSWSPIFGRSFISRTLTLTCFLRAALRACSFWYLNLP